MRIREDGNLQPSAPGFTLVELIVVEDAGDDGDDIRNG